MRIVEPLKYGNHQLPALMFNAHDHSVVTALLRLNRHAY